MTRCIWLRFFGELRGAATATPHESGPRITSRSSSSPSSASSPASPTCPHRLPRRGARRASPCASSTTSSRRRRTSPASSHRSPTPSSRSGIAVGLDASSALVGIAARLPAGSGRARAPTASPSATRLARAGYTLLVNKYYFDCLYTTSSSAASRARSPGRHWFNQNVIDGVVNGVGARRRRERPVGLQVHRPGRRRRARQRLRRAAEGAGQVLRKHPDRQGPGSTAPAVRRATLLAAIFVIIASAS